MTGDMSAVGGPGLPSGTTRLAAVIGDPVRHSLSPLIHNTGFRVLGLDWVFVALEVSRGRGAPALDAVRTLGIDGLSVTMPLKAEVIAGLDRVSSVAQRLGAVNVIARVGRELVGDNTDGPGFVNALRHEQGFEPEGKRCVVVGAGGAARAVIVALAEAGAAEVTVVARRSDRAVAAIALAGGVGRTGVPADVAGADLVVNATPVGMHATSDRTAPRDAKPEDADPDRNVHDRTVPDQTAPDRTVLDMPFDPGLVGSGQLVCDLIYHPLETPLLVAAARNGAHVANGVGMLIHQAALSFTLWTGETAPVDAMFTAVREVLANP